MIVLVKNDKSYLTTTDKLLFLLWRHKWLTRQNIYDLFWNLEKKKINSFLEILEIKRLVKTVKVVGRVYFLICKKGARKIGVNPLKTGVSFSKEIHNYFLYKLICKNEWASYLTERDFIQQVGFYKIQREKIRVPDLVIFEGNKVLAIEFVRTIKSKKRYEEIFDSHNRSIGNYYSGVHYYCSQRAFVFLNNFKKSYIPDVKQLKIEGYTGSALKIASQDVYKDIVVMRFEGIKGTRKLVNEYILHMDEVKSGLAIGECWFTTLRIKDHKRIWPVKLRLELE